MPEASIWTGSDLATNTNPVSHDHDSEAPDGRSPPTLPFVSALCNGIVDLPDTYKKGANDIL